ncbi:8738_t:CDS:2 [Ambispora leptoticha]|uniref:8738_t:CDS:1 n=1 Tax=Ambispora leptoticha TaxID=144679 RepID=A0A9N9DX80_9GLOM|nr:8738_t:CDS:2 [Ambispora leptoticha]
MSSVSDVRHKGETSIRNSDNVEETPPEGIQRRYTFHEVTAIAQQVQHVQHVKNIQKVYRNHRATREREGKIVSARSRERLSHYEIVKKWKQVVAEAVEKSDLSLELKSLMQELVESDSSLSDLKNKLQGLVEVAAQIGKGSDQKALWLILDNEHWLEIYDENHRYGANLKVYHDEWLKSKTSENFFYWLDEGEGSTLSLSVSREELNKQKVKYLTQTERDELKVIIKDGLLYYEATGELVHTNPSTSYLEKHAQDKGYDLIELTGNLEKNGSPNEENPDLGVGNKDKNRTDKKDVDAPFLSVGSKGGEDDMSMISHDSGGELKHKWIYVTDCKDNLYVHEKIKGHFHHSSFLAGGAICAAGGIKVYHGKLLEINPKSGHYKPGDKHFEALVEHLKGKGLDTTYTEIINPSKILEDKLKNKYHSKLVAHVKMNFDLFIKNVETVASKRMDEFDRIVTKAENKTLKKFQEFTTKDTTNHEKENGAKRKEKDEEIIHENIVIESKTATVTATMAMTEETTAATTTITTNITNGNNTVIKEEEKKAKRSSGFAEFFAQVSTIFGKEKDKSAKNNNVNQNNSQNILEDEISNHSSHSNRSRGKQKNSLLSTLFVSSRHEERKQ